MPGRDQGDVPDEVSFINTQLSGRYVLGMIRRERRYYNDAFWLGSKDKE